MLNIPTVLLDKIRNKNNILIAGIGGGFDVYGGLPLYYTLNKLGKNIVFANYSFADFNVAIVQGQAQVINSSLLIANPEFTENISYYPEGYLAKFLKLGFGSGSPPVYVFAKTGTNPLLASYQYIIETHKIDMIILIDGGVDSVNTGFETGHGTIIEDTITIAAVSRIEDIEKVVMCIGFGTEVEEDICGYNVLMNMSNLIKNNSFIGSCSLVKESNSYIVYKNACIYAFEMQGYQKTSHIHRRIIPAIEGEFGDFHMTDEDLVTEIFISPFMSICWFFKFEGLFLYNKILPHVSDSVSFYDVVQVAMPIIQSEKSKIPYNSIPY